METTDPRRMRDAMLNAVHHRATDDAFDPHAELRDILAPLGFTRRTAAAPSASSSATRSCPAC